MTTYQPTIIAFACQWCTYAGADLAGLNRLASPANVRVIMIPCTGRLEASLIVRAFMQGADGVIVGGCHPGTCHYGTGNYRARRRWALMRTLLDTLGFDLRRLKFAWVSAAEGQKWAQLTHDFTEELSALGPASDLAALRADWDGSDIPSGNVRHFASAMSDIAEPDVRAAEPAPLPPELIQALGAALQAGQPKTEDATTGHITTGDVTTGDVTTGDVTTGYVTTGYVTTGDVTTGDVASGDVASGHVTAQQVTTGQVVAGQGAAGSITRVGGWRCRPTLKRLYPAWVTSPDELSALRRPAPRTNIARLLKEAPPHDGQRWGLVVRPQELATLNVLAQENAFDPALLTAFLIDQEGEYVGQGTLEQLSQSLENQTMADGWGATSPAARERLARWRQRPRAERFDFWREAAQRCLRCYACRQACPICRCQQCFAEDNQPQLFPTASTAAGNWPWLTVRALHLAGRCVGCGACARACPAGLPLDLLHAALRQTVQDEFGFRAGTDPHATPFPAVFSRDDPQNFVE